MKKGLTEVVFILDKSGSMSGLEKDTIGGFNSLIEKQRKRLILGFFSYFLRSKKYQKKSGKFHYSLSCTVFFAV